MSSITAIAYEIAEIETLSELKALWCFGQNERNVYADALCVPLFKEAIVRLKSSTPVQEDNKMEDVNVDIQAKLAELLAELQALKAAKQPKVARVNRKYKILSHDVKWSTKPQVHAIAAILGANFEVGTVVDEDKIIEAMIENEVVLHTRQGGKRIWDYYKGDHVEGLLAHGNIARA